MRRPFFFPFLFIIPLLFLGGWVIMLLWNAILPDLLGVGTIGYWQSFGLLALTRILFGGFHGGGCGKSCGTHRWDKMAPEDREQMRSHWRSRCSWKAEPPASDVK